MVEKILFKIWFESSALLFILSAYGSLYPVFLQHFSDKKTMKFDYIWEIYGTVLSFMSPAFFFIVISFIVNDKFFQSNILFVEYADYIYVFWVGVCFTAGLFVISDYFKKLYLNTHGNPIKPKSIAQLYNEPWINRISGKKRKTDFHCIKCGKPIEIFGRFKCRAGHVPTHNRCIFDNCEICDDVFEYIRCDTCGEEIDLYQENYIHEKAVNIGKEYISRKSPYSVYFRFYIIWGIIFTCAYLSSVFLFNRIESFIINHTIYYFIIIIMGYSALSVQLLFFAPRKQTVMENPYTYE